MRKYLFTYLVFLLNILVFSFLYALIIHFFNLKTNYRSILDGVLVILSISCFVLGMMFCNIKQKKALINGFISVFPIILIMLIINFKDLNLEHTIRYLIIFLSGIIGGIIGVRLPKFKRNI